MEQKSKFLDKLAEITDFETGEDTVITIRRTSDKKVSISCEGDDNPMLMQATLPFLLKDIADRAVKEAGSDNTLIDKIALINALSEVAKEIAGKMVLLDSIGKLFE